jgi:4-hydroxythreonine-4-phosphate dehydrogenase
MTGRHGPSTGAPPLAVTMGEPAGIGSEVLLKTWATLKSADTVPFFAIADADHLRRMAARIAVDVRIIEIHSPSEAPHDFPRGLPVMNEPLKEPAVPGAPITANGRAVIESIERAVSFALEGEVGGIVTNPIHKATLMASGFPYPGHTEFLAALCSGGDEPIEPVMMLVCPDLRVVPITIHCGLKDVFEKLTTERIVEQSRVAAAALRRDFGIARPRLAIAGLNPHAGEDGAFGREEIEIITPAIRILRADGIEVSGPHPADSLFHDKARTRYDVALCMYHDQALIPLKTIDFDRGVNITLGLPIVRTSPDHGTAFDIAGTGKASPDSLIAAIRTASTMARNRSATAAA